METSTDNLKFRNVVYSSDGRNTVAIGDCYNFVNLYSIPYSHIVILESLTGRILKQVTF